MEKDFESSVTAVNSGKKQELGKEPENWGTIGAFL